MLTSGEGRYRVWLQKQELGDDLIYTLGGGERPHVGGVVLKVPGQDVRTLSFSTHRDLDVLVPIAEAASLKYGCTVVAVGGIHIDDATKEEIGILVGNVRELLKEL
jgi:gallate decarboxylase subunit D